MTQQHNDPVFLIKATYSLDPGDVEAFKAIAAQLAISASQRPGCAFLNATQDVLDPRIFYLLEGWDSQAAFEAQLNSEAFQALLKQALALRIAARSGTRYQVSAVEPLPMPA